MSAQPTGALSAGNREASSGLASQAIETSEQTVTRAYLAERVHQVIGVSKAEASIYIDQFFDEILQCVVSGGEVKLSGFGAFSVRSKREREGRNPKTGAKAKIRARRVVVFRPSQLLHARVEAGPEGGNVAAATKARAAAATHHSNG